MQTSTWKAVLLLLLAGIFGGAVGSVVTAKVMERPGPHGADRGSAWYVALLKRELKLTPAQQDSVRSVLQRHRGEMDSLWGALGPPMERMREAIRADIRLMLTPEQQTRFTEVTAQLDARRRDRMKQDSIDR